MPSKPAPLPLPEAFAKVKKALMELSGVCPDDTCECPLRPALAALRSIAERWPEPFRRSVDKKAILAALEEGR